MFNFFKVSVLLIFLGLQSCNHQEKDINNIENSKNKIVSSVQDKYLQFSDTLQKDSLYSKQTLEKKIYGFMDVDEGISETPPENQSKNIISNPNETINFDSKKNSDKEISPSPFENGGSGFGDYNSRSYEKEEATENSFVFNPNSNSGNKGGDGDGVAVTSDNGRNGIKGEYTKNKGRALLNSGGITEHSQEEGKVALEIYVDEKGLVYRTKFVASKSNGATDYLLSLATKWAHTMQYEKDLGGGNQYVGIKVFKFSKH